MTLESSGLAGGSAENKPLSQLVGIFEAWAGRKAINNKRKKIQSKRRLEEALQNNENERILHHTRQYYTLIKLQKIKGKSEKVCKREYDALMRKQQRQIDYDEEMAVRKRARLGKSTVQRALGRVEDAKVYLKHTGALQKVGKLLNMGRRFVREVRDIIRD